MAVDFEAEGLLDGLDGEARDARERLLGELSDDGAGLDELREAVAEDRLILLPAERALRGPGRRISRREVHEETGASVDFLTRLWTAMGMPDQGPDEPIYTDADIDAVRRALDSIEAGVPEDGILEITRVVNGSMSALAASMRRIGFEAFAGDGSEHEVGSRFAWAMRDLVPVFTPVLEYALTLHLHQQVSSDYVDGETLRSGAGGGEGGDVAVCFADMVGFTKLGEQLEASEVGALSQRLAELAQQAAGKRVRVIKMIGDAAMLTAPAPDELLESALELVDLAEREGEGFPQLRAGVASGEALARGGDLFGRPVNLASRITQIARPGSVLCSETVGDSVSGDERFELSFARKRDLKGFKQSQKLFRVRVADEG